MSKAAAGMAASKKYRACTDADNVKIDCIKEMGKL